MALVIIGDFYFVGILAVPPEADPVLVVDTDAMLTGPATFEGFEPVTWWDAQLIERRGGFKLGEFP
jgi:hypothetical protein